MSFKGRITTDNFGIELIKSISELSTDFENEDLVFKIDNLNQYDRILITYNSGHDLSSLSVMELNSYNIVVGEPEIIEIDTIGKFKIVNAETKSLGFFYNGEGEIFFRFCWNGK